MTLKLAAHWKFSLENLQWTPALPVLCLMCSFIFFFFLPHLIFVLLQWYSSSQLVYHDDGFVLFFFLELSCIWLNVLDAITQSDPSDCPNRCGKMYKGVNRKHHLKQHLVYECGVMPKFECGICHKKFYRKYSLKVHSISKHKRKPALK